MDLHEYQAKERFRAAVARFPNDWTLFHELSAVARDAGLVIVPALNKIDLPAADPDRCAREIEQVLGIPADQILQISAKTGEGVPELLDAVIERLAATMPAGGRVAVSGLRRPERWPEWLIRLGEWVNRPFGVTRAYETFRPWESVRQHLRDCAGMRSLHADHVGRGVRDRRGG